MYVSSIIVGGLVCDVWVGGSRSCSDYSVLSMEPMVGVPLSSFLVLLNSVV